MVSSPAGRMPSLGFGAGTAAGACFWAEPSEQPAANNATPAHSTIHRITGNSLFVEIRRRMSVTPALRVRSTRRGFLPVRGERGNEAVAVGEARNRVDVFVVAAPAVLVA